MKRSLVFATTAVLAAAVTGRAGEPRARAEGAKEAAAGLTLDRAVELALARNERAAISRKETEAAEARVDKARAFFFPDVVVSGGYTRRARATTFQKVDAFSATALATLSLFDARAFPLYRAAKLDRDATRASSADERRLLAFEAADAFLLTLGQEQVLAAAERRREQAVRAHADARARQQAQLASSNDVTRAELELATAEREVTRASAAIAQARLQLGYLIDAEATELGGPLVLPDDLLAAAAAAPAGAQVTAEKRLDVVAARLRAASLRELAKEPSARAIPSLDLTGQYRVSTDEGFAGDNTDWFLGLTLTWVLWDGGERGADRDERTAIADIASLSADASSRRVAVEVKGALVTLTAAQAAVTQSETAVKAAQKNALEAQELYRRGLATALEVADAGVRQFEAEVALARERYSLALALLDLRAAQGMDPLGQEVKP